MCVRERKRKSQSCYGFSRGLSKTKRYSGERVGAKLMYNNPCNASTSWLQHILLFFFFYHFLSLVLITQFVYNLFSFSFKSALTRLVLLCQTVVVFFYRNERRRCFQSSSCKNRISYLNFPRTHVKVTVRYTVAKSTGNFFEERYLKYNYRLNERIAT